MHDPRPLNLGFVRDATKNEIHTAHKGGVEINALSAKHGLPVDRIKAILMLKDLEDDARKPARSTRASTMNSSSTRPNSSRT